MKPRRTLPTLHTTLDATPRRPPWFDDNPLASRIVGYTLIVAVVSLCLILMSEGFQ